MLTGWLFALVLAMPPAPLPGPLASDVDRLVQAARQLTGAWPAQPPPPITEVAIVARHGKAAVPLLMALLSDDPGVERDAARWKVQQQASLALGAIYASEPRHCGRIYCDGNPPERIGRIKQAWQRVVAADAERETL